MILEIDTTFLTRNKITAHQYTIAKLVREDRLPELKSYLVSTDKFHSIREDLAALYKAGFVAAPPGEFIGLNMIKVTSKFSQRHAFTRDPFEELYDAYPTKVLRKDGTYDYLRVDQKQCRRVYYNIIRESPTLHEFILKCLNAEIEDKEAKGSMSYMKRMPAWLSSEGWKAYADVVEHYNETTLDENNSVGYGYDFE